MDPIVVEPLNSAPPVALMPNGTYEDETPAVEGIGGEENLSLGESKC